MGVWLPRCSLLVDRYWHVVKILKGTITAVPFLIIRTTYALLSEFQSSPNSKWSTLYGSATIFAIMGLLMEYFIVIIYIYAGMTIVPSRNQKTVVASNEGQELWEGIWSEENRKMTGIDFGVMRLKLEDSRMVPRIMGFPSPQAYVLYNMTSGAFRAY